MAERFTATLEDRYVVVPLNVRELWGEARPPVTGTVNGLRSNRGWRFTAGSTFSG